MGKDERRYGEVVGYDEEGGYGGGWGMMGKGWGY
ncbi:uncharacterized protein G2W53_026220 [Senna tora]|uniref:Uncharacterized protein n=1 Tax=Senna tora TaxID=362788 RepID=A0A834TH28_9FABA|nr:uncharacterized protein G2W53_026220 [Senna tora]